MDRRDAIRLAGFAILGVAGLQPAAQAAGTEDQRMPLNPTDVEALAEAYPRAWNSGSPQRVASFYSGEGEIVINRGTPWRGREGIAEMAAGFFAGVPDLKLVCDGVRVAGTHVAYLWTFTGHDSKTGKPLTVHGWEEWDVGVDLKVKASRGWYDAEDYAQQVAGGGA